MRVNHGRRMDSNRAASIGWSRWRKTTELPNDAVSRV